MLPLKKCEAFSRARAVYGGEKRRKTITSEGEAKSPFMLHRLPSLTKRICYQRSKTQLQSGDKSDLSFFSKWGKS